MFSAVKINAEVTPLVVQAIRSMGEAGARYRDKSRVDYGGNFRSKRRPIVFTVGAGSGPIRPRGQI